MQRCAKMQPRGRVGRKIVRNTMGKDVRSLDLSARLRGCLCVLSNDIELPMDDDMMSVVSSGIAYYRVTLCIRFEAHDNELLRSDDPWLYGGYEFLCPGPTDARRMQRATCFFDHVIFRDGLDRQALCDTQFTPQRSTQRCAAAMVDAYERVVELFRETSDELYMFVVKLERTRVDDVLLASPCIVSYCVPPMPLQYKGLKFCRETFRVTESSS